MQFQEFPKMARLSRECVITEKIDGTNAQVAIAVNGEGWNYEPGVDDEPVAIIGDLYVYAGSRNRWLSPANDNFGFAKWASANAEALVSLGPGRHFGEWWGSGIQRGYGLAKGEKRFSLFNAIRWAPYGAEPQQIPTGDPRQEKRQDVAPECCHVVPVLYRGTFNTVHAQMCLEDLEDYGSTAAPGFMNPEGIVVYHVAGGVGFKKTIQGDEGKHAA